MKNPCFANKMVQIFPNHWLTFVLLVALVPMASLLHAATADRPPNFVVIFTDDQGYADLGCFGSPDIQTPCLDAMAQQGMKFTSFYAQPICGPSRAAIMTGCYPLRVAEHGNTRHIHPVVHSDEITVAEVLKSRGYATACFGKWDLARHSQGGFLMDLFPTRQGFDYFFGTPSSNDHVVRLYRNEELLEPKADMAYLTQRYTDEAIGFMKKHKDEPFFVYMPHTMPHYQLAASPQFKGKSKRGLYGDVIEEIDFHSGRILDAIKEMGLEENTYVLFTSDNGPWLIKNKELQDGHLPDDHGGSAGPLRSGKVSTFEGGQRVPTILWGPGRVPAGTTCDKISSTLDILPTLAALAGAKAPTDRVIDGEDIRHLFHGQFDQADPDKAFYYYLYLHLQAVRQGNWKLHLARDARSLETAPFKVNRHIAKIDREGFDQPFLVDLDADLGETTNVADSHPEVVKRLQKLAELMREDLGDFDRVGKNMRFFDPIDPRPTTPPVPVRKSKAKKKAEKKIPGKQTSLQHRAGAKPASLLVSSALSAIKLQQGEKPNVLFLAVDDLNDWIGCMGGQPGAELGKEAKTPHLDRLAQRGVLFERAYCAAPICNPSRASLMSGVLPSTSGIYGNSPNFRSSPVLKDIVTLPQYFKQQGYHAMRGGKIYHHFGPTDPKSWHEAFPSMKRHLPTSTVPPGINGRKFSSIKWGTGPLDVSDEEMDDGKIATWAIDQLKRKHDKPFFLAVGFYHPHLPWYAPQKYFDMHPIEDIVLPKVKDDDRDDIPKIALTYNSNRGNQHHKRIVANNEWRKKVQAYQASISFADAQVGRVLDALDASDYADNTVIVLWSDHGWHLGEKQHWTKFTLWEESARVPMIIVGPKSGAISSAMPTAVRCPSPVGLIDIYPTLVELCGLDPQQGLDGISLVPLLKNPQSTWERPALTTHGQNNHTLRTKQWRYTRWRTGEEELYDHQKDPMEWTNLASDPKYTPLKAELSKGFPTVNAPDAKQKKPTSESVASC